MTILTFIWPLWSWPSTYLKMCFRWHFSTSRTTTVQNYFEIHEFFLNPCIVQVMAQTSSIYDHFDLYLTPVTLTFNVPEKMFLMALLLFENNKCAKLFLKSMHKCTSNGPDKLNIWLFWHLFDPVTLTFNLPEKMFQITLFLLERNNCAKLFLKSMRKCTSFAPDKLNTCVWPFWPLFDPCDLDLQPT